MIHAQLTHVIPHISNLGLLFQDQGSNVGFSLPEMWARMGIPAKAVVIILFIMSIWSLAVIIDRALYFSAARKQSREFAPKVAGGISEALVTTAFGLLVAIPAVMTFNYFTNKVEAFDVEMDNSSSELVDYFIKQSHQ